MPSREGIEQIKLDEGFTARASHLTLQSGEKEDVLTIGYGYNIDAATSPEEDLINAGVPEDMVQAVLSGEAEISEEQAGILFNISIARAKADAQRAIAGFDRYDNPVQDVLVNMAYQLGSNGLKGFTEMRRKLSIGDIKGAAGEIMNSHMARTQSTNRAERLSKQLIAYADTLEKPEPVKRPSAAEVAQMKTKEDLMKRLSKVYNKEAMRERLAKAIGTMTNQQKIEEQKIKAREEDTKNGET